ncbi:15595_t:CDS:2, partial [Racocetra fulgida]
MQPNGMDVGNDEQRSEVSAIVLCCEKQVILDNATEMEWMWRTMNKDTNVENDAKCDVVTKIEVDRNGEKRLNRVNVDKDNFVKAGSVLFGNLFRTDWKLQGRCHDDEQYAGNLYVIKILTDGGSYNLEGHDNLEGNDDRRAGVINKGSPNRIILVKFRGINGIALENLNQITEEDTSPFENQFTLNFVRHIAKDKNSQKGDSERRSTGKKIDTIIELREENEEFFVIEISGPPMKNDWSHYKVIGK